MKNTALSRLSKIIKEEKDMAKHAIVRTDKHFGTDVREGLVSFK